MTNNAHTPGGNATTAGAVERLAMARRIASETKVGAAPEQILRGDWDNSPVVKAALAAIIETQELIAQFIERDVPFERDGKVVGRCSGDMITAAAIRSGQQFRKDEA